MALQFSFGRSNASDRFSSLVVQLAFVLVLKSPEGGCGRIPHLAADRSPPEAPLRPKALQKQKRDK